MSIGVGLICDDGIVMAADTLFEGNSKTHDRKLWGVIQPANKKLTWAIASAGLDAHIRGLVGKLQARTGRLRSFNGLHDKIEETSRQFFEQEVWTTPQISIDQYPDVLIAIAEGERQRLYTLTTSGGLSPVAKPFAFVGSGGPLADYLAQTFFDPSAGITAAQYLAAHIVRQAKAHAPGVGGQTHIAVIPKGFKPSYLNDESVARIETYFELFMEQASKLTYAGLYPTPHAHMDADIDELKRIVREIRRIAHQGEPFGEQLQQRFGAPRAATPTPPASTDDPKDRPPSPESPGESGGS
ncbi:MAG: hypothetical protein AB7U83_07975 [Vicinamibacterales bacterium]